MHDPILSELERRFLRRTLQLAIAPGPAAVHPDPMVGAVLVSRDDPVAPIGWGAHARYGDVHAEVAALRAAAADTQGATLYCNLEPCAYEAPCKRQPPCSEAILNAGISRVVVGQVDPHPRVRGEGIVRLRSAGLRVDVVADPVPFWMVNPVFTTNMALGRPFMHLVTSPASAHRARRTACYERECEVSRAAAVLESGGRSVLLRDVQTRGTRSASVELGVDRAWDGPIDCIDGTPTDAWTEALHAALDDTLHGAPSSGAP